MPISATTASPYAAKNITDPAGRIDSIVRIKGDTAYTTGGSALPSGIKPVGSGFYGVAVNNSGNVTRTYIWNNDTQLLMAFVTATGAEVAAAVDLSADTVALKGIFA